MSYIFDWSCKKNGAVATLKGAPLSTLIAYSLYADDYGNSWASSNSEKTGGLNRVTGLSHDAIAGKTGARQFLLDHECIEIVSREVVKRLYGDRPAHRRPPVNADVYHLTKRIARCKGPDCTCKKSLQVTSKDLYVFLTSTESVQEVDSINDSSQDNTSSGSRPNLFVLYEENIGALTPIIVDELKDIEKTYSHDWFEPAMKEMLEHNVRNLKYFRSILEGWRVKGRGPKPQPKTNHHVDEADISLMEALANGR